MKGDFTRNTFDPRKHYSRVLMQQGRVQLDADWNEQGAIFTHAMRQLARDLIGPHGTPEMAHAAGTPNWNFRVVDDIADVVDASGAPLSGSDATLTASLKAALAKGAVVVNPGRYYVDGILVENLQAIAVPAAATENGEALLVYLDVWERLVTGVEDPAIREVALGGPDTAVRAAVTWQVRTCAVPANANGTVPVCSLAPVPAQTGTGLLRAWAGPGATPPSPCSIAPESRYRGMENQLYRVEIHHAGDADSATFKWSRDNGALVFPAIGDPVFGTSAAGKPIVTVALATLGRDDDLGLAVGDWVELLDVDAVADDADGALLQIGGIDRNVPSVSLLAGATTAVPAGSSGRWMLRRWDGVGGAAAVAELAAGNDDHASWIALEDGIVVCFVAATGTPPRAYCRGDYWLIPARVATGDIEWPQTDAASGPVPAAVAAQGVHHHYAPLAQSVDGGYTSCRYCFPPLAGLCADSDVRGARGARAPAGAKNSPASKRTRPK